MGAGEFDYTAIGCGADSGHDNRRDAGGAGALDCGGRVGILVSVKVNVAVDHYLRIAGVRAGRIAGRVAR